MQDDDDWVCECSLPLHENEILEELHHNIELLCMVQLRALVVRCFHVSGQ